MLVSQENVKFLDKIDWKYIIAMTRVATDRR